MTREQAPWLHARCGRCGGTRSEVRGFPCDAPAKSHMWMYAPIHMTQRAIERSQTKRPSVGGLDRHVEDEA